MIGKLYSAVGITALLLRNAEAMTNCLFTHRLMSAQSDQDIKSFRDLAELAVERLKEQSHRRGASAVRHDEQDALILVVSGGTCLRNQSTDLGGAKSRVFFRDNGFRLIYRSILVFFS